MFALFQLQLGASRFNPPKATSWGTDPTDVDAAVGLLAALPLPPLLVFGRCIEPADLAPSGPLGLIGGGGEAGAARDLASRLPRADRAAGSVASRDELAATVPPAQDADANIENAGGSFVRMPLGNEARG